MANPTFQERRDRLLKAVGAAIGRWANLEIQVLMAFSAATALSPHTAAALFAQVKTFALTLDLTHAAMTRKLEGRPELARWNSIVDYIRELSGDRNYIAHTNHVASGPGHPGVTPPEDIEIGPPLIAYMLQDDRRDPMAAKEVEEIVEDIQQAIELLMEFIAHAQMLPPYPPPPALNPRFSQPIVRRRLPRKQRQETKRKTRPKPPPPSVESKSTKPDG